MAQQSTPTRSRPAARRPRLSSSIPVRFPDEMLEDMRRRAEADHRTISSWIRHIVQQELESASS